MNSRGLKRGRRYLGLLVVSELSATERAALVTDASLAVDADATDAVSELVLEAQTTQPQISLLLHPPASSSTVAVIIIAIIPPYQCRCLRSWCWCWSCKNGLPCITACLSLHLSSVFTSMTTVDTVCLLLKFPRYAMPVAMSVLSCWVGCMVVMSNYAVSLGC